MPNVLTDEEIAIALAECPKWSRDGDEIVRTVTAPTFAEGIRLVDAVAVKADEVNHHPDIDIRWTDVTFRLSTHSEGGLTQNDFNLAAQIDQIVNGSGAS
jgi:4a-hydroxytetrahydrobiopterin dehydratase